MKYDDYVEHRYLLVFDNLYSNIHEIHHSATNGYIVHLAGLDLSRGWCMQGIASALPKSDPRVPILMKSAQEHASMGFRYVFSGNYEGDHWLATFAIYLQSGVGVQQQPHRPRD